MPWTIITPWVSQIFRDFLRSVVGPYLVAHGVLNGSNSAAFMGAVITLAGIFWGWFTNSGYNQMVALMQKLTRTDSHKDAVAAAQALPTGAAVDTATKSAVAQSVTGGAK